MFSDFLKLMLTPLSLIVVMVNVSRIVNRVVSGFTSQVARRALRALGVPRNIIPVAVGMVRELNRQARWGDKVVWRKRLERGKMIYKEFANWQREVSPVYRFRGGSRTVQPFLSQETVRDKYRDPSLRRPAKIDGSTVIVGGLGFVVVASLAGPWLAKRVNYVDPLDVREAGMTEAANTNFDLKF
jgi:hypothetical protein